MPYIIPRLPKVPIYGAPLTLGLLGEKLSEFGIKESDVDFQIFRDDAQIKVGKHFVVDMIRMTHSIPDNFGMIIRTPAGNIVHTGDFKLDNFPSDGKLSQLEKLAAAGDEGVMLLISDSTNAERPGTTPSEADIALGIEEVVAQAKGRVFITTFASQIHRLQNIIHIAEKHRRKVIMEGRSMLKYSQVATQLEIMHMKEPLITADDMGDLGDAQLLFMCTGSQGQPMSTLTRLAMGNHAKLALKRGDSVIMSSNPIPGNEEAVNEVINRLYQIGVDVFYPPTYKVHASGHASQEDLKVILDLVKPTFFLPWHGEPRHQINHMRLAQSGKVPPKRVLVVQNGDIVQVSETDFKVTGKVAAGGVYVDGLGVGDISDEIIGDRQMMGAEGVLIVTGVLHPVPHVELISRGFVRQGRDLENSIKGVALEVLETGVREKRRMEDIRDDLYGAVRKFVRKVTGRTPVLIPVLVE
jgi:ribonuclease J